MNVNSLQASLLTEVVIVFLAFGGQFQFAVFATWLVRVGPKFELSVRGKWLYM